MNEWFIWLDSQKPKLETITLNEVERVLKSFKVVAKQTKSIPLTERMNSRIHELFSLCEEHNITLANINIDLLKSLVPLFPNNTSLQNTIKNIEAQDQQMQLLKQSGKIIGFHLLFWTILFTLYSHSKSVQTIFFWNPWVRRVIGLGYIGFLVTYIPFLRRIILKPFTKLLVADANLDYFEESHYFNQSRVIDKKSKEKIDLLKLSTLHEPIVLIGRSGLGKTMFIRYLVKNSQETSVFMRAERCQQGVKKAIRSYFEGYVKDEKFLDTLIYIGAIHIYIDGVNEVTADTRVQIVNFIEESQNTKVVVTTQPAEWTDNTNAKQYEILPLSKENIEAFLMSRYETFETNSMNLEEYSKHCQCFIQTVFDNISKEEKQKVEEIVSNPMDLTSIAQLLIEKKEPNIFNLHEQQVEVMMEKFKALYHTEFPLETFSEMVYQMRLNDEVAIPNTHEYQQEIHIMSQEKMLLKQAGSEEWIFRHDKIIEYFILQTFLGMYKERINAHLAEPKFRGIYFLLILKLPYEEAEILRETIINYADEHKEYDTLKEIISGFKTRHKEVR